MKKYSIIDLIRTYKEASFLYLLQDFQTALDQCVKLLAIAKKIGDKEIQWIAYHLMGHCYKALSDDKKALEVFEQALDIALETGNRFRQASILYSVGECYISLSEYKKALECFSKSLYIARELRNREGEGCALTGIGRYYYSLSNYKKALEYFEESLKIIGQSGDKKEEGIILGLIGECHIYLSDPEQALTYLEKALEVSRETGNKEMEVFTRSLIGECYSLSFKFDEAIKYYEEALNDSKKIIKRKPEGVALRGIGNCYYYMSKYEEAIDYWQNALVIARGTRDKETEMSILSNIGQCYATLLVFEKALDYSKQALSIAQKIKNREKEADCLASLGRYYCDLSLRNKSLGYLEEIHEYVEEAIKYLEEALDIAREVENKYLEGRVLSILGSCYCFNLLNHEKGIEYFKKALNITREIKARRDEGTVLLHIGQRCVSLSNYKKALEYFEESLKIAEETGNKEDEGAALFGVGLCYYFLSKFEKAHDYFAWSVEIIESIRKELQSEEFKLGWQEQIVHIYEYMTITCHKLGRDKEAYAYVERNKSRAFLDLLAATKIKPAVDLPKELMQKEDEYISLLRQVRKRLSEKAVPQEQRVDTAMVSSNLEDIYNQMEKYDLEYVFLRRGRPISNSEIQQLLAAEDRRIVLVEYFLGYSRGEEKIFIFVICSSDLELHIEEISLPHERLLRYVKNYFRELDEYPEYHDTNQTWLDLSQYLIYPIAKHLKSGDIIYVIPYGILHYIPFHALMYNGQFLIEEYQIVYCPSASTIKYCQAKRRNKRETCLPLGVAFEEEAEKVAKLFNTSAYKGKEVTKDLVRVEGKDKDIIHFSCHGFFDDLQPASSGLVLGNGEIFTINDIFNLRLNADLVTLSACETGINEQRPGDELIGLTRGFIYAGSPSVLVSLWNIDAKSTQQLMEKFYKYLLDNKMPKVEALQRAQLEIMTLDEYRHPYYWAPFILVGDWK